jgi:hypothetical protein
MAIPGSAGPFLLAQLEEEGGYEIERSLRLNSSDSAYLSRTPASAGNRKTWSWAGWVKRSKLGTTQRFFATFDGSNQEYWRFDSNDTLRLFESLGTLQTTQVFRDVSAWYHIVVAVDTTQATASDRIKFYLNGTQVTTFSTATYPSQNVDGRFNSAVPHYLGTGTVEYFDGYLAGIHFIDGQALTPSSFGEFDTNGVWQPIDASGLTYGTNGFHLPFSDNSTAAALGTDTSGNSNTWTVNNISVTAGAGNDSVVDSPTNYGEDTGAGGGVRGNYATLNALRQATGSGASLANGNLDFTCVSAATGSQTTFATFGVSSGKYYFEMTVGTAGGYYPGIGINTDLSLPPTSQSGDAASGYMYLRTGNKFTSYSITSYGSSYTTGDVVGVAFDLDAGTITFYKNGSSQGQAFSGITGTAVPCIVGLSNASGSLNFGQRAFAYPLSGFKALCTTNLPEPTIADGGTAMDVKLYTGNGSTQTISGLNFSPDLVWIKARSAAYDHQIGDTVRGVTNILHSNLTAAESTLNTITGTSSDGFTVSAASFIGTNANGQTFAAWTWDAGTSTVTNTQGSISSQVRANASAGFSIVTYTGTGANATVGHGLGVAPGLIIVKQRSTASSNGNWAVQHQSLGATKNIILNSTAAADGPDAGYWNSTSPTSSVFSVGTYEVTNRSTATYVAYCFAPVAGYSSFGSYTGNGSTDGPFVYTGFRPAFVLTKKTNGGAFWMTIDSKRDSYNVASQQLYPNASNAEGSGAVVDFLSNGFKARSTSNEINAPGATYIYAAFAEHPFSISRAR